MKHHLHLQVVDCGKEGLHSTALPVSLPLPTNSIGTMEEDGLRQELRIAIKTLQIRDHK